MSKKMSKSQYFLLLSASFAGTLVACSSSSNVPDGNIRCTKPTECPPGYTCEFPDQALTQGVCCKDEGCSTGLAEDSGVGILPSDGSADGPTASSDLPLAADGSGNTLPDSATNGGAPDVPQSPTPDAPMGGTSGDSGADGALAAGGSSGVGAGGSSGIGGTAGGTGGSGGTTGGTGGIGGACSGTMCGSSCSDLRTDVNNCGACGRKCGYGTCQSGDCICQIAGLSWCTGACVNFQSDDTNCGGCGIRCVPGQHCSGNVCVCDKTSCPDGCCKGTTCEDFASQASAMCGTAGAACGTCTGGTCQMGQCSCPSGQTLCSGACVAGSCPVVLASGQDGPMGIEVDSSEIYWTVYGKVLILSKYGGSSTVIVSGQNYPTDIVMHHTWDPAGSVTSSTLFWTDDPAGTIMKQPAGFASSIVASGQTHPSRIAVDETNVYWTDASSSGAVMKMPLAGGDPVVLASGQNTPLGIIVLFEELYWTNSNASGMVMRMPTDGSSPPAILASGQDGPWGIATDGSYIYWTNDLGGTVMKSSFFANDSVPTVVASGQDHPRGIVADGTDVYWTNCNANGTVMKVHGVGGTPTTLVSGQNGPLGIHLDSTSVYWTNYYGGTVMKVTPR